MDKMAVTKSDLFPNDTMGMENKTVIVTTILVRTTSTLHYQTQLQWELVFNFQELISKKLRQLLISIQNSCDVIIYANSNKV